MPNNLTENDFRKKQIENLKNNSPFENKKAFAKRIIIMNGKGGVGKDALCEGAARKYRTWNISSIDPIKSIARQHGWNGEKDPKSRRFLAELKQTFVNYNDLPNVFLKEKTEAFMASETAELLFVHIREPEQIKYYRKNIYPAVAKAVLIKRKAIDDIDNYGNKADDNVNNYEYDLVFNNDLPLEESIKDFISKIEKL